MQHECHTLKKVKGSDILLILRIANPKLKHMLPDIQRLLLLQGILSVAKIAQLGDFLYSFMCIRYGVSIRSLSRYSGYSLRTWFRFLKGDYPWAEIRAIFFKKFVYQADRQYLLSIDEVVEGKSRNKTHGIARFWSSILNSPIRGICFFAASIIDVSGRKSYMMATEQVVFTEEDKKKIAEHKQKVAEGKLRSASGNRLQGGRRKGTKNKPQAPNDTASYRAFSLLLGVLVGIVSSRLSGISLAYVVADGKYAAKDYIKAIREVKWHLITRLPVNAVLQLPYIHPVGAKKTKRKYDKRVDFDMLDEQYLKDTRYEDDNRIQTYQLFCYNTKICAELLNVVIVKVSNLKTQKVKYTTFACTDLSLSPHTLIDYYSLRFQIEFDFREAKQFFGLSDFKNYTRQNVTNFVNLCLTAVLVAKILQQQYQQKFNNPNFSILDLKILFNARFTVKTAIKLLRKSPESIFNPRFAEQFIPTDIVNAA